ncbi:ATP-binding protein [Actinopolyspora mortivallis]|nr:tetratricopeptide repeat protein [Actinopolyspora mortivallis]
MDEFVDALRDLRQWAGGASYRELARRMSETPDGGFVSHNTVADLFRSGRRWLDLDLVDRLLRAFGLEAEQVTRWREACIAAHISTRQFESTEVLRQLPDEFSAFVGREHQLSEVLSWAEADREVSAGPTVVSVEGMGGIGKTQFAVRAAHHLIENGLFGDAQLYVNLRGFDRDRTPLNPAEVLDSFLHRLGVPGSRIPNDLDGKVAMYRSRLVDRETLILLDNVASEDQVRELIPPHRKCMVLLTSRRSLAGLDNVRHVQQSVFTSDEAVALLRKIAGSARVDSDVEASEEVVRLCGYLPLAVALAAQRLRARTAWDVSDLSDYLAVQGLEGLTAGGSGLQPIFDLSYHELSSRQQRCYRLLALHPGNTITPGAAAALTGTDAVSAQKTLEHLLDQNLLQQNSPGVYEFHDLLRAYVGSRSEESDREEDREAALERLFTHYVQTSSHAVGTIYETRSVNGDLRFDKKSSFFPCEKAGQWLAVERANLVATAGAAAEHGYSEHAVELARILANHMQSGGYFREDEILQETAIAAAERDDDLRGRCEALLNLGSTFAWTGRYKNAVDCLSQAETGFLELAEHRRYAETLNTIGRTYDMSSRPLCGIKYYQRSLRAFTDAGDTTGKGRAMVNLGFAYERLGKYREALRWGERGLDLLRTANAEGSVGRALTNVGRVHAWLGNFTYSFRTLHDAIAKCRDNVDVLGEGAAFNALAFANRRANRPEEALELLDRSYSLFANTGNLVHECRTMVELGTCLLAVKKADQSLDVLQKAFEISRELDDWFLRGDILNTFGDVYLSENEAQISLGFHGQALELAKAGSDSYNQARATCGIGEAYLSLRSGRTARRYLEEARSRFVDMGVVESSRVAELLKNIDREEEIYVE